MLSLGATPRGVITMRRKLPWIVMALGVLFVAAGFTAAGKESGYLSVFGGGMVLAAILELCRNAKTR